MNRLPQFFVHRRVVLPVVHVESLDQALRNTEIAECNGADGVFLINHAVSWRKLLAIHHAVKDRFARFWVGVNCLDLAEDEVFQVAPKSIDGIWVDNAGIEEGSSDQTRPAKVLAVQKSIDWTGLYFGGVAFKYQRQVDDFAEASRLAVDYMDVVTTSGPGTGRAASVEKIMAMKHALGDHPLAIASGVTPDNVVDYLPFCDCFLVATGICESFDEFDPKLVKTLVDRVRTFA